MVKSQPKRIEFVVESPTKIAFPKQIRNGLLGLAATFLTDRLVSQAGSVHSNAIICLCKEGASSST